MILSKWKGFVTDNTWGLPFAIGPVFYHLLLLPISTAVQRHFDFACGAQAPNLLGLVTFFLTDMNSSRVPYLETSIR
jgi:hypothetical protein